MQTCFSACLYSLPLQVWQYTASMAHFRTCLEIAACAGAEKRWYTVAITYDELCRKQWNLKADRGDRGFEVNVASLEKDKDLLKRARAIYDAADAVTKALSMLSIFLHARLISRIPVQAKASKAQPSHEKNDARPSGAAYQKGNQNGLRFQLRRITHFQFCYFNFSEIS